METNLAHGHRLTTQAGAPSEVRCFLRACSTPSTPANWATAKASTVGSMLLRIAGSILLRALRSRPPKTPSVAGFVSAEVEVIGCDCSCDCTCISPPAMACGCCNSTMVTGDVCISPMAPGVSQLLTLNACGLPFCPVPKENVTVD